MNLAHGATCQASLSIFLSLHLSLNLLLPMPSHNSDDSSSTSHLVLPSWCSPSSAYSHSGRVTPHGGWETRPPRRQIKLVGLFTVAIAKRPNLSGHVAAAECPSLSWPVRCIRGINFNGRCLLSCCQGLRSSAQCPTSLGIEFFLHIHCYQKAI